MTEAIDYSPPDIVNEFIKKYQPGELFYTWIVGPYGSAKTTGEFFKLVYMASLQEPSPDGVRYSRCVVVRNTYSQIKDTTLVSWDYWFKDGVAGKWVASENKFIMKFGGPPDKNGRPTTVECEVLFRPLDTAADVQRVLGLEITFAIIDEFREIPRPIIEGISGRLGRYKLPGNTKVTNWGMWGASNPGTEDLWWYDYLHGVIDRDTGLRVGCVEIKFPRDPAAQKEFEAAQNYEKGTFAWYYKQPSGFSPDAENIENLPGGRKYYENMAKGKSEVWKAQYIDAEWGFSIGGTSVVNSFVPSKHIAASELRYNRLLRLVVGVDPGLGGSAFIFMQQSLDGKLFVLGELVQSNMAVDRLLKERLVPYLNERFPKARVLLAPDPAAAIRSGNDAKTAVRLIKAAGFPIAIESNNRLPLRLNAIDYFCNTLISGEPALQIDPIHCPVLIRALKGGWRWSVDQKKGDEIKGNEPEKNPWSHPGDAFGYGCRYFHKGLVEQEAGKARPLPRLNYAGMDYHMR